MVSADTCDRRRRQALSRPPSPLYPSHPSKSSQTRANMDVHPWMDKVENSCPKNHALSDKPTKKEKLSKTFSWSKSSRQDELELLQSLATSDGSWPDELLACPPSPPSDSSAAPSLVASSDDDEDCQGLGLAAQLPARHSSPGRPPQRLDRLLVSAPDDLRARVVV